MYDKHWSDDDLVARLYGVKPEDPHIRECGFCAQRWESVCSRHVSRLPGVGLVT